MTATASSAGGAANLIDNQGLISINQAVDVIVGNTATILQRPAGMRSITMYVKTDEFSLKVGKWDGNSPNPAFPSDPSSTTTGSTAGNAAWPVPNGKEITISAPSFLTLKGSTSNAKLYYFWSK